VEIIPYIVVRFEMKKLKVSCHSFYLMKLDLVMTGR